VDIWAGKKFKKPVVTIVDFFEIMVVEQIVYINRNDRYWKKSNVRRSVDRRQRAEEKNRPKNPKNRYFAQLTGVCSNS